MNKIRLDYLDSLRGVAFLLVFFTHFYERTFLTNSHIFHFFGPGQIGVVIFFLISGYIIPYSIKNRSGEVPGFVVSRFFRLYPAFWVSVFLAIISANYLMNKELSIIDILANLTMIPIVFGKANFYSIYWTLFVEISFYITCILLYKMGILFSLKSKFLIASSLILLSVLSSFLRQHYGLPSPVGLLTAISLMLFSGVLRGWVIDKSTDARRYTLCWCLLFVLCFPIICKFSYNLGADQPSYLAYVINYYLALVIFILCITVCKINSKPIIFIGVISYSAYLLHPFVIDVVSSLINLYAPFSIVLFLSSLLMTLAFSYAMYRLIEKPCHGMGQRVRCLLVK